MSTETQPSLPSAVVPAAEAAPIAEGNPAAPPAVVAAIAAAAFAGPPLADQPPRIVDDPRVRLHELARTLIRSRNRQAVFEYLRLRRALM